MSDEYQTVTLVLDNGQRVTYTGRAQIDVAHLPNVLEVIVSPPRSLPKACSWEDFYPKKAEST